MVRLLLVCLAAVLCGACSPQRCDLLLYGINDQRTGMAVLRVKDGKTESVLMANALRPSGVTQDWSRSFVPIKPLALQGGVFFYCLAQNGTVAKGVRTGIYRLRLQENTGPEFLVETPRLSTCIRRRGTMVFVGTTEAGAILQINADERSCHQLAERDWRFAAWNSDLGLIAGLNEKADEVRLYDPVTGKTNKTIELGVKGIKSVYGINGARRFLLYHGWQVGVYDLETGSLRNLTTNNMVITDAVYDGDLRCVFALIPSDDEGRTLVVLSVDKGGDWREIMRGVLADSITLN